MPITIRATDAGFHFKSAIGQTLAPEVFLEERFNRAGSIYQSAEAQVWHTRESFLNGNIQIEARLARDAALAPGASAGAQTELAIDGFEFVRITDGATERIGELNLDEILPVTATFTPNGSSAIGLGSQPNWIADVADPLDDVLSNTGYVFEGGAGRDIFNPTPDFLPSRGAGLIHGKGGHDVLIAQAGGSEIRGGAGNDAIGALGGQNSAWGGAGADNIDFSGLRADQRAFGGSGNDRMTGGQGDDNMTGGAGNDHLKGGLGDDILRGAKGRDTLKGGGGSDDIKGNGGRDKLNGGFGDDVLTGGNGADKLIGGRGADVFVFDVKSGKDVIRDFDIGTDLISLGDNVPDQDVRLSQVNQGVLITLDASASNTVLLRNIELGDLNGVDIFV